MKEENLIYIRNRAAGTAETRKLFAINLRIILLLFPSLYFVSDIIHILFKIYRRSSLPNLLF